MRVVKDDWSWEAVGDDMVGCGLWLCVIFSTRACLFPLLVLLLAVVVGAVVVAVVVEMVMYGALRNG